MTSVWDEINHAKSYEDNSRRKILTGPDHTSNFLSHNSLAFPDASHIDPIQQMYHVYLRFCSFGKGHQVPAQTVGLILFLEP